jgi:hypothetical protein
VVRLILEKDGTIAEESQGRTRASAAPVYVVHSVRSAAAGHHGRRGYGSKAGASTTDGRLGSGSAYLVRLTAWNCTCAAFAFAAFPTQPRQEASEQQDEVNTQHAESESTWAFGGVSLDDGEIPCCKHLLVCLLVERWGTVLGSYIVERTVCREEMAGIIADI